jgi:hypothetical protein
MLKRRPTTRKATARSSGITARFPGDCIREKYIETVEDARRIVADYVKYYNEIRLHSALGYVTPQTKLLGKEREVFAESPTIEPPIHASEESATFLFGISTIRPDSRFS